MTDYNKAKKNSTTHVRYLHVTHDYPNPKRKYNYGDRYSVKVKVKYKDYVVWTGYSYEIGEKVAIKVQELMSISTETFIEWFKNDKEGWLINNGYKNANRKGRPRKHL